MKGDPEERAIAVGRYIAGTGATVRAAGGGVWRKQKHHLERPEPACAAPSPGLWAEVQAVVQQNKAERHLRGGEATRLQIFAQITCAGATASQYNICKEIHTKGREHFETRRIISAGTNTLWALPCFRPCARRITTARWAPASSARRTRSCPWATTACPSAATTTTCPGSARARTWRPSICTSATPS